MTARSSRLTRGAAASAFATWAAALSHEAAGGGHPALSVILLALLVSVPASVWLAGRHYSRIRVAASIGLSQLAFHSLFVFFGPASRGSTASAIGPHNHSLTLTPSGGVAAANTDMGMIAFHGLAAATTVLFVFYAERTARRALSHGQKVIEHKVVTPFARAAALIATLPWAPPRASISAWLVPELPRRLETVIGQLRHRGPPLLLSHA